MSPLFPQILLTMSFYLKVLETGLFFWGLQIDYSVSVSQQLFFLNKG